MTDQEKLDALIADREAKAAEKAVEDFKSQQVDSKLKGMFFGGGAPEVHVPKTWEKGLETPSMDQHQKMYLASQKDPDLRESMKQLGAIVVSLKAADGDTVKAEAFAKARYPKLKGVHDAFAEANAKALTVSIPSAGGFAVPMPVLEPIIPFLYNKVAVRQLGATVYDLPNGNASVPRINATSAASYLGEATPAAETGPTLGAMKLSVKKLMALVPLSNDLIMSNSVNYEAAVAQDLVNIMNIKADYTSLYGTGYADTPLGLQNLGVQTSGNSTTPLDADVPYTIVGLLDQANVPMISPGWIVNGKTKAWLNNLKTSTGAYIFRDEISRGELAGYPLVMSNQLSYTSSGTYADFVFGDFSEFAWGEQTLLELQQSREATYKDASGNLQSAFANDLTLIRAISRHDFNVKHAVSFVFATYKLAAS